MEEIKKIDIKEFRKKGYLQELNRRFLHPLGLALSINIDEENGVETLDGIWDYRDDKEGIYYDIANSNTERIVGFNEKKSFIDSEFENRCKSRKEVLGFDIEPID